MKLKHKSIKVIIAVFAAILLIAGIIFALPHIADLAIYLIKLFLPFIIAYLFAMAVNPLMIKLNKNLKLSRTVSSLILIIVVIGGLGGLVSWIVYKVFQEFKNLYFHLPEIYNDLTNSLEVLKVRLWGFYELLPANIQQSLSTVSMSLTESLAELINTKSLPVVSGAGTVVKSVPTALVTVIVFILATFFMVSDFEKVRNAVKKPFSQKLRNQFALASEQIKKYLGGYVKAQLIIMSIVFVVLFAGLSILGVPYSLLIALGTAIFDALPFFGSGAVLWPWSIISFIYGDLKMGFGLIIMYVVIIVIRQLIEPKIVSKNIGMNPILTLMSMYLGLKLLNVGGMILGPIILVLIFSLHKAGIFDKPIYLIKHMWAYLMRKLNIAKTQFIKFWESE